MIIVSLIISYLGRNIGERDFTSDFTLDKNLSIIKSTTEGNIYTPRIYVKILQIAADTLLDIVNKAELKVKERRYPYILCLEGYEPRIYEKEIVTKYNKTIKEIRTKMRDEINRFIEKKVTYNTITYLLGNKDLPEYYRTWKIAFPLGTFEGIKQAFDIQNEEGSMLTRSLRFLSNLGYKVPELNYSEENVLLVDLEKMCTGIMDIYK